jgi:hypothetical protein
MDAGGLPPRWGAYARRLPSSLEDLKGPAAGEVELPLHVAWSGRRVYDVGQEDQRLVLYTLLLAEAQRTDLERFVHRESPTCAAGSQDGMTISPAVSPRSSLTMNIRAICDSARDMKSAPSAQSQVDYMCHYRLHNGL